MLTVTTDELQSATARFDAEAKPSTFATGRYRMPYVSWGHGPRTLVFVHGLCDWPRSFAMLMARLCGEFRCVAISLADGRTVSGVLRSKTDKEYTIVDPEGKVTKVPKDDVEREKPDKSAMPDDLHKKLSRRELRDVIEFLAGLK